MHRPFASALLLVLWVPLFAVGQPQSKNMSIQDRCTDLERNEVPCPMSEEAQVPAQTQSPSVSSSSENKKGRPGWHPRSGEEPGRAAANMGSTYVPLDNWVYPAFDRMMALGYAPSAFAGLRPWTRMEFGRLVHAAGESIDTGEKSQAASLYLALLAEFAREDSKLDGGRNRAAEIESAYVRVAGISGTPLNQSYYFGQSLTNDYGRPYSEGFNSVSGVSARAMAGPFAIYLRGEYQHASSAPGLPLSTRISISNDYWHEPAPSGVPTAQIDRLRLLDAYASFQLNNWQFSFGKQSLWWGPGMSGPLSYSNNAEPLTMARISQVTPVKLPSIFSWLGPIRTEFFVGRLAGQHFVNLGGVKRSGTADSPLSNQPFLHGEKFSFKPTPNLEFGVSRTGVFGGPGFPLTLGRVEEVMFSLGNTFGSHDPGDRRSGFDFSYRIPGLRNWLVLYNDSMTEDEISPIGYPRRAAMNPGIYIPQIPKVRKLDFRAEAVYTDLPNLRPQGFFYFNVRYVNGYTNHGNILGSWVGRQGRGLQLRSTYWFSPRNTMRFEYRNQTVNKVFLQGGALDEFAVKSDFVLHPGLSLSSALQYQRWRFAALNRGAQSLVISTFQITYWPKWSGTN